MSGSHYINLSIVSAARGESAVGLGAYIARGLWLNSVTGRTYNFSGDADDLIGEPTVILPEGVDPSLADPLSLWIAAERAEITTDRKTKLPRFKKNAALAKHVILALPKDLGAHEQRELALEWAKEKYSGVGVMIAIHRSDDEETGNIHAHLLVTTRVIGPNGFGQKARHLDPRFAGIAGSKTAFLERDNLPGQWRAFQNDYFKRKGIPLAVGPSLVVSGVHWGNARFVRNNDKEADDRAAKAAARALLKDPRNLLAAAVRHRSAFSRKDLLSLLARHDIRGEEAKSIAAAAIDSSDAIPLFDPETGERTHLFTTLAVREQEQRILAAAATLMRAKPPKRERTELAASAASFADLMGLADEQRAALMRVIEDGNISLIRGVAGAGKSYTVKAIRQTLEEHEFDVIGLAPTNTVTFDMAKDGFSMATTLHSAKYRMEKLRKDAHRWNRRTCVIVDEAGMVDTGMFEWLLETAAAAGARVVLVGDDAQLSSVERGGMFAALRAKLGAAELKEIRRQDDDWAKAASLDLAEGRVAAALKAYDENGKIYWSADLDSAEDALVTRWSADVKAAPRTSRFVYVATNAVANDLNNRLQSARFGNRDDFGVFDCSRGRVQLYSGDRVQFHATDKKLGIFNGQIGTVTAFSDEEITVDIDGGSAVSFDPRTFEGWGLGYAGTVYRGQGKTLPQAYALYDHVRSWSARSTYVALTRHRKAFDLFVPRTLARDLDVLGRQMTRNDDAGASLAYLTQEEAETRFPKVAIQVKTAESRAHTVSAADANAAEAINRHLATASVARFRSDYIRLDQATKGADPTSEIHQRVSDAKAIARRRGFIPRSGLPDPRCLEDLKRQEPLHQDPALAPERGEVDIRPLLQEPFDISLDLLRRARNRLMELEAATLKAIDRSLQAAWTRAAADDRKRYPIVIARAFLQSWAYRWRHRLGASVVADVPPGRYRRDYLALFDKARKSVRVREFEPRSALVEPVFPRPDRSASEPQLDQRDGASHDIPVYRQEQLERERLRSRAEQLERRVEALTAGLKGAPTEADRQNSAQELAIATLSLQSIERKLDEIKQRKRGTSRPQPALLPPQMAPAETEERSADLGGIGVAETRRDRSTVPEPASDRAPPDLELTR